MDNFCIVHCPAMSQFGGSHAFVRLALSMLQYEDQEENRTLEK